MRILNDDLNDVYLPLDLLGTFWTRYEAVNEAVMKLILVLESSREIIETVEQFNWLSRLLQI